MEVDEAALLSHQRFAGDDATRLAAIGRAAASGADIAMVSRGGYGLTRLLPDLPYKHLAKAVEGGMQFVGLSDFTALQCALQAKTGASTWAGPALGEDFGSEEPPDEIMAACFDDLACGQGEGTGWRLPMADVKALAARQQVKSGKLPEALAALSISGATLWGGNLSVICALMGTPYMPAVEGGILFLEDTNEHPYRIERQLTQLVNAGILAKQQAVLLGSFNRYTLVPGYDRGFNLSAVVHWIRGQIRPPVLTGLPFGHVPTKVLLPVGQQVDLMVDGRDALIFWG